MPNDQQPKVSIESILEELQGGAEDECTPDQARNFDPVAWGQDKYGEKKLSFLSPEEYKAQLDRYKETINATILEAHQEFREDLSATYPIDGVFIFGSWARGGPHGPHKESDLDVMTISNEAPGGLIRNFVGRLKEARIGIVVDNKLGHLIYTDTDSINFWKDDGRFDSEVIIVTPYPEVEFEVRELLELDK